MTAIHAAIEPGYARGSAAYRRIQVALGAVGMTTFAQLYFAQPLIPTLSRDFEVSAADAALTVSGATVGLAAAVLDWSTVADRFGRARTIKVAVLAAVCVGLLVPFAPSYEVLIALRVLQGVALGGTPALALTYLSEEVNRRDAMIAAGSYISGTVIGGLIGRLVAAQVAEVWGWRTSALVVAVMSVLGAALVVALLPASRDRRRHRRSESRLLDGLAASLKNPAPLVLYAQAFLLMGSHVAVYNYLGYRLEQAPFDLPPTLTALIFLAGLSGVLSSRLAVRLAARYGRRRVLLCASATMAVGGLLTIPNWLPTVIVGLLLFTTAYFSAHAIASGWVGQTATSGTAQATSIYTLFYYAGASLFGWFGGVAFTLGWVGTAAMAVAIVLVAFACVRTSRLDRAADYLDNRIGPEVISEAHRRCPACTKPNRRRGTK